MKKVRHSFLHVLAGLSPFWVYLTLFKFAGSIHYGMLSPLGEKVFPVWLVGVLIGIATLLQLVLDVPAGYLLDKIGYKKLLIVTTVFFIISSVSLLFGLSAPIFVFSLFTSTFGWLFFSSGANSYVISRSSEQTVGRFISAKEVFGSLGVVLGSIALSVVVMLGAPAIGLILVGIFFVALIAIGASPADHQRSVHHSAHAHLAKTSLLKEAFRSAKTLRPASYILIGTTFCAAVFYAMVWFVVPLVLAHQYEQGVLSLGLGIFDFSVVVLGFVLGRLVDTFNKKLLVLIGILIFAIMGILLGFYLNAFFLLFGFIATAGDELSELSLWSWMYGIKADSEHIGLVSGIIGLFDDFGWAVGPVVAGILYTYIGASKTILVGGLCILLNLILFVIFVKHPLPKFVSWPLIHIRRKRYKH
jgi:MFS family permease